jgi:positive regulator of sigma E activity
MKQAWNDLKSFITISMIILLFIVVIANLFGATLADNLLILITNLITAVFTYYFAKQNKDNEQNDEQNDNNEEE